MSYSDDIWDAIQDEIELGPEEYQRQRQEMLQRGKMIGWLVDNQVHMFDAAKATGRVFKHGEDVGGFVMFPDRDAYAYYREYIINLRLGFPKPYWIARPADDPNPAEYLFTDFNELLNLIDQMADAEEVS